MALLSQQPNLQIYREKDTETQRSDVRLMKDSLNSSLFHPETPAMADVNS